MVENQARLGRFEPGSRAARWWSKAGITAAWVYEIPLTTRFRGITVRDGLILRGSTGLAEAAPFWNYEPAVARRWFEGAIAVASFGLPVAPAPVALNVTVPIVSPEEAGRIVRESGCATAKVKVADARANLDEDAARLRAVRKALDDQGGYAGKGRIRIDVNAAWSLEQARENLPRLVEAAGGLEYAEQPCRDLADLAALQASGVAPIAADETIRLSPDPVRAIREVCSAGLTAMVIKAMPLGCDAWAIAHISSQLLAEAVKRQRRFAVVAGAPGEDDAWAIAHITSQLLAEEKPKVVVSSALDSGVGLLAGMSLATGLGVGAACGLGTGRLMRGGILVEEPRIEAGRLIPPADPQLNLDLPLPDGTLAARWRDRLEIIADS